MATLSGLTLVSLELEGQLKDKSRSYNDPKRIPVIFWYNRGDSVVLFTFDWSAAAGRFASTSLPTKPK